MNPIPVMDSEPGPTLFNVMLFALLTVPTDVVGKVRLVGLYETIVPVPLNGTL